MTKLSVVKVDVVPVLHDFKLAAVAESQRSDGVRAAGEPAENRQGAPGQPTQSPASKFECVFATTAGRETLVGFLRRPDRE